MEIKIRYISNHHIRQSIPNDSFLPSYSGNGLCPGRLPVSVSSRWTLRAKLTTVFKNSIKIIELIGWNVLAFVHQLWHGSWFGHGGHFSISFRTVDAKRQAIACLFAFPAKSIITF
jgi:hypothetical protein